MSLYVVSNELSCPQKIRVVETLMEKFGGEHIGSSANGDETYLTEKEVPSQEQIELNLITVYE
jgi:hypothetical protein